MTVTEESIKDTSEQNGGGGVSVYYSHSLQMLFFSYVNGKSFMAPLKSVTEELDTLFHINVGKSISPTSSSATAAASASASAPGKNGAAQPLCQWAEIVGHPGTFKDMVKILNLYIILSFTHLYHFFPVSILSMQCSHCLLQLYLTKNYAK